MQNARSYLSSFVPRAYTTARSCDKTDKVLLSATVIPYRGAWLEYETDANDVFYVRIDKNRKIPITSFIRAIGVKTDAEIKELFGEDPLIVATLDKDPAHTAEEALIEIYKKMRPGEPPSVESATSLMDAMFFDMRRYDISAVGRYKYNKKLNIARRITGHKLVNAVADPMTGEVLADAGEILSREKATMMAARGVNSVVIESAEGTAVKVFGNGMVDVNDFSEYLGGATAEDLGLKEKVRFTVLKEIIDSGVQGDELKKTVKERHFDLIPKTIIVDDMLASICYLLNLGHGIGTVDDIDHLGNRRHALRGRAAAEPVPHRLLPHGASHPRAHDHSGHWTVVTPQALINIRPVTAAIKEFFGSSPLSQFMDQNNPLAELTHKRRLSALGPGGLSRDRASFEVRDVHYSHYGRMCPIETPGRSEHRSDLLSGNLRTHQRIRLHRGAVPQSSRTRRPASRARDEVGYMTADVEDEYIVCAGKRAARRERQLRQRPCHLPYARRVRRGRPQGRRPVWTFRRSMVVSVATAMIPFLENDDANRALMGANMQRQAVPLLEHRSADRRHRHGVQGGC